MSRSWEEMKALEADARAEGRRGKASASARQEAVATLWNLNSPPHTFERLIPIWQNALLRLANVAPQFENLEHAWRKSSPHLRWEHLNDTWRVALGTLHSAFKRRG